MVINAQENFFIGSLNDWLINPSKLTMEDVTCTYITSN